MAILEHTIIQPQPEREVRAEMAGLEVQVQQVLRLIMDAKQFVGCSADNGAQVAVQDTDPASPPPGKGQPVSRRKLGQGLQSWVKGSIHMRAGMEAVSYPRR